MGELLEAYKMIGAPVDNVPFQTPEHNGAGINHLVVRQIITDTVNETVLKLKMAGLMKDDRKTAYQKTEAVLYNYCEFQKQADAKDLIKKIDESLQSIEEDPYYKIIPMFYFAKQSRETIAADLGVSVRTVCRQKTRLINQLKIKLFCADTIFEIFL